MPEPHLILQPTIRDCTREQVEAHIEQVRNRRMLAAIEFHNTKNMKLSQAGGKIQDRLDKQLDMLEKEIGNLERAEIKVTDRLNTIEALKQELGVIAEQIVDPNEDV